MQPYSSNLRTRGNQHPQLSQRKRVPISMVLQYSIRKSKLLSGRIPEVRVPWFRGQATIPHVGFRRSDPCKSDVSPALNGPLELSKWATLARGEHLWECRARTSKLKKNPDAHIWYRNEGPKLPRKAAEISREKKSHRKHRRVGPQFKRSYGELNYFDRHFTFSRNLPTYRTCVHGLQWCMQGFPGIFKVVGWR